MTESASKHRRTTDRTLLGEIFGAALIVAAFSAVTWVAFQFLPDLDAVRVRVSASHYTEYHRGPWTCRKYGPHAVLCGRGVEWR